MIKQHPHKPPGAVVVPGIWEADWAACSGQARSGLRGGTARSGLCLVAANSTAGCHASGMSGTTAADAGGCLGGGDPHLLPTWQ